MPDAPSPASDFRDRLTAGYLHVRSLLLAERNAQGFWEGELSSSALATATAVMAVEMVRRQAAPAQPVGDVLSPLIDGGVRWLAEHQNGDGGWGDTTRSQSNISTTMLCHAVFQATQNAGQFPDLVAAASNYVERAGGIPALRARY